MDHFFLNQFLISSKGQNQIDSFQAGGNRQGLNFEQIKSFLVPLPSLPEQRKIAAILNTLDNAIKNLNRIINSKVRLKESLIQDLLTRKKMFKEFKNEKLLTKRLDEVFSFLSTASYSRSQLTSEIINASVFCIHYGDIHATYTGPYLDLATNKKVPALQKDVKLSASIDFLKSGDLLVADVSEDYKGVATSIELKNVNSKKIIGGLHTFALRDKGYTTEGFRAYILKHPEVANELKKLATGSSVHGLSKTSMQQVKLYIPSKKEQKKIAIVLSQAEDEIKHLHAQLDAFRQKKKGLMQVLLTGKKRVKI